MAISDDSPSNRHDPGDPERAERDVEARDETVQAETAPSTPEVAAATPPARQGGGGVPVLAALLGGFLAGAIGYLAAYYTEFGLFTREEGPDPIAAIAAQESRIDDIEALLGAPDANEGRLAASEEGLQGVTDNLGGLDARITGLEEGLSGLQQGGQGADEAVLDELNAASERQISELGGRIDGLRQDLSALTEQVSADDGASDAIAEVRQRLEEVQQRLEEVSGTLSDQAARLDAQSAEIADAEAAATAETQRISAEAATAEIRAAVENGEPFANAVAAFQTSSDIPVPSAFVENGGVGVATLSALQTNFPDAARDALDASLTETAGEGTIDRFGAFLRAQTGARSTNERQGSGPDAILSRAEARLANGDLQATLDELGALPQPGQAAMSDWTDRARARLDTIEALGRVSQSQNGN